MYVLASDLFRKRQLIVFKTRNYYCVAGILAFKHVYYDFLETKKSLLALETGHTVLGPPPQKKK